MKYFFSVDLGTMQDFTAISVLERVPRKMPADKLPDDPSLGAPRYTAVYVMRHLERLPLGLDYPTIVEKIKGMLSHEKLARQSNLIIDATGAGLPILQMMQQAGLAPIGVNITGGGMVTARDAGYNVPKAELVSALNLVFQSRRIKIPVALRLKAEFLKELERFKVTMNNTGVNTYESAVASVHDDLVLSVAMGIWYAEKTEGHTYFAGNRNAKARTMDNPLEYL
ncbi:MAG: hypothetical protein ACXQS5_06260 [Candidatus Methanospirareceae archaeon]